MSKSHKSQESQDHSMPDAPTASSSTEQQPYDEEFEEPEIRLLGNSVSDSASFLFINEDHTLGNALRHMVSKNPDVEFCGYTIPHPAENKMHLRIQTYDNADAQKVLEKGLDDLIALCDTVLEKFEEAEADFEGENQLSV